MEIKIDDQTGKVTVSSNKTQSLMASDSISGQKEAIVVNNDSRTDKVLVAKLVKKSNRILVTIRTHRFPFDFFPDTLNIEESRLTIINRTFFLSSQVHSVDIKDISNIFVNTAPFFAQLVIVSKTFTRNEIKIKYLRISEAVMVRRIIEGLRTFIIKQIDTSGYSKEELIAKLKQLSMTEIVT
ncbi:hypothetical protein COY48_04410 [Candidatus Collierbacteria bacterium CG_4_10_14_0_8_um_filter_43_86]|uniref:YokE-like PH domain-containing protein n=2 Tax=Candidatus Collieribacteriota TaxID=1752725 RepID=A0A2H0DUW3_9BACT|nr:MAG: hypothetical protein COW83_01670 [Candidatus Collierbacteria bacterium CG22_combo_CG10-13_8_21_14_all_43_12]PIZ24160.1 MAG: hypothetical protein COY48_04410 [Candidatus Collierbacteria bacterium CG_4_10_14_0_8_um_filter_43_86]PJB48897.1 MAG: hypothetical protein CO104_00150 [Candidatus Collierbacteria bacterium CG_4_9_14_3_um_filter_43_16]